jgi:hypothetical protein
MRGRADCGIVMAELDRWRAAGRMARLWLRDDDAVRPTAELDALVGRLRAHGAGCLLAVIPMLAEHALAERLLAEPLVLPAMHGAFHASHALPGRKSEETPEERNTADSLAALREARKRFAAMFGEGAARWYVPPWNRIPGGLAARLPELGFRAVSSYRTNLPGPVGGLALHPAHVDIMDWRGGSRGRPTEAVMADLAEQLAAARTDGWRPVGILCHHLVHDAAAWQALDAILALPDIHGSVAFGLPGDTSLRAASTTPGTAQWK